MGSVQYFSHFCLGPGNQPSDRVVQPSQVIHSFSTRGSFSLFPAPERRGAPCPCSPHFVEAMCLKRAATSINADSPSGKLPRKLPTTRVLLRISRLIRSSGLFVLNSLQCSMFFPVEVQEFWGFEKIALLLWNCLNFTQKREYEYGIESHETYYFLKLKFRNLKKNISTLDWHEKCRNKHKIESRCFGCKALLQISN